MKYRIIGSGFEVTNYPTDEISDPGEPDYVYEDITPEAKAEVNKIIEKIKIRRGEVISACVDIDTLLGKSISLFFLSKNPEKRKIFHDLILDTTAISIFKKKEILELIMIKHPEEFSGFSPKQRQKFFEDLNYVIKMRNALAHGDVIIDYFEKKEVLKYYNSKSNKKDEVVLSSDFFEKLREKITNLVLNFWSGIAYVPLIVTDEGETISTELHLRADRH
jgi:hypothetical protein